ncbi:hypothetical protein EBR43_09390, partial [bacterium]|nr:hypothetical protein [bacterium]
PQVDTGRGERSKTSLGQAQSAVLNETSKKNVKRQHSFVDQQTAVVPGRIMNRITRAFSI